MDTHGDLSHQDAQNSSRSVGFDNNEAASEGHNTGLTAQSENTGEMQVAGTSSDSAANDESAVVDIDEDEHLQQLGSQGLNPRHLLDSLLGADVAGSAASEESLWQLLLGLMSEPARRRRLDSVRTIEQVVNLLSSCQRILILTGAGVSVSCGIPDFRSADGLYARLSREYPQLPSPQAMFDVDFFCADPRPFFKFAKEIFPSQFQPSLSHRFIRCVEQRGSLLRNYTQNIDTLEQAAGIQRTLNCHGSFATASCMRCKRKADLDFIKGDVLSERIPMCPDCPPDQQQPRPVLKPDIVFFGESLPPEFAKSIEADELEADLLIVVGSSLKVQPVSNIPSRLLARVPQILINREPLRHHDFDVCLLGDCDGIAAELGRRLNWPEVAGEQPLAEVAGRELLARWRSAGCVGGISSHLLPGEFANCGDGVYAFRGAELTPDDVTDAGE